MQDDEHSAPTSNPSWLTDSERLYRVEQAQLLVALYSTETIQNERGAQLKSAGK